MKLREPFLPQNLIASSGQFSYDELRALVESVDGGSHQFRSSGQIMVAQNLQGQNQGGQIMPPLPPQFFDHRTSEGWRHVTK